MADFSKHVSAGARIYYFDARTGSKGNKYISITEMNLHDKSRSCIHLHPENFESFQMTLNEAIHSTTWQDK